MNKGPRTLYPTPLLNATPIIHRSGRCACRACKMPSIRKIFNWRGNCEWNWRYERHFKAANGQIWYAPFPPPSSPRSIGIKISGGRKRRRKSLQKLWHIKDINKKMAAKTRQKSERGKIEMEMEMENVARWGDLFNFSHDFNICRWPRQKDTWQAVGQGAGQRKKGQRGR